jgi:hypothetical protein
VIELFSTDALEVFDSTSNMGRNDFIMTIDSDTEDISSSHSQPKKGKLEADEDAHLNSELTFDLSGDPSLDAGGYENDLQDIVKVGSKPVSQFYAS